MENVPTKPSAARVIVLARVNFCYEHTRQMAKITTSMPYQAVGGKIILGWVTFLSYVTLPSQGNYIQTDVVYPALVGYPVNAVSIVSALKLRCFVAFSKLTYAVQGNAMQRS